jgi:hypothetical protein
MPLKPALPPAIPPFQGNIGEAWELIGQKEHYLTQLQREMLRRADEVNKVDDENAQLKSDNERLQRELEDARRLMAEKDLTIGKLTGTAGGRRTKRKET